MKHYVLFIVRDTYDSSPVLRFLEAFRQENRTLSKNLANSGGPHLRQLVQCGRQIQIAIIYATLAPIKACQSLAKCWYDSEFDKVETAVEAIRDTMHPYAENANDSILIRHSDAASQLLDHLLDSLPPPETAKLHVVLDEQLVPLWPFSTACELLAGSLLRSAEWHAAVFYPLQGETARPAVAKWLEPLDGAGPVNPADRVILSTRVDNHAVQIAIDVVNTLQPTDHTEEDLGSGGVRWSPACEVIASVDLQSVPLTLFCPGLSMYSSDTDFLEGRNLKPSDGLLVRFNGWSEDVPTCVSALTTRNWRQAVRRGQLDVPTNPAQADPNLAMHFILTVSGAVYPLVNEINMDFVAYFRALQKVSLPQSPILSKWIPPSETPPTLQDCDLYSYLIDPTDWPLRGRLQPIEDAKDQQVLSTNAVAWSAKDIAQLFDRETGRALAAGEYEIEIPPDGLKMKPTLDVDAARAMDWPQILAHTGHDVYYNRNTEDEQWERACHRWKEGSLRRPTATSLDAQPGDLRSMRQADRPVRGGRGRQSPRKNLFETSPQGRRRSPRRQKQISPYRNTSQVLRRNPFKDVLRELPPTTETGSPVQTRKASSVTSSVSGSAHAGKARTFSRLESQDEVTQSPAKRQRPDKSERDNDKLRRKLRAAVATALEEHGIDLKHPLFSSCGKKLFSICKTYTTDLMGTGRTSEILLNVAKNYAKQVVDCELSLQRLMA